MSDQSRDTITMTLGELDTMKETIRTQAKVDGLIKFMTEHDAEDRKRFEAIFTEIKKVDDDVRKFPQRLAQCQQTLREEVETKYVSKKEVRAGFLAISALQILIGLILIGAMNSGAT